MAQRQVDNTTPKEAQEIPAAPTVTPLQAMRELARRGRREILPQLGQALNEHPELWQHYGDLAGLTQRGWVRLIAGPDLLLQESIIRQVEVIKQDLAGPTPGEMEKLLVERIVTVWLQVQYAELLDNASGDADGSKQAEFRLKRQESAQKRLLSAIKMLAVTRRLAAGISITLNHTGRIPERPTAAATVGANPDNVVAAEDRLNRLFSGALAAAKRGEPV